MSGALQWTPVSVPDFSQTMARAQGMQANRLAMLAQQRQMADEEARNSWMQANAAGFASDNDGKRQNLLAQLATVPGGAQMALPMIQQLREQQTLDRALPMLLGGAGASPTGAAPGAPSPGGPPLPAGGGAGRPLDAQGQQRLAALMPHFEEASRTYGIPVPVLVAAARQESNFDPAARGRAGEVGVMQIMPSTARQPGWGIQGVDPNSLADARANIMFGAQYLAARGRARGVQDWNDPQQRARAFQAYNGGGDPNYVQNVEQYIPGAQAAGGGADPNVTPVQMQQGGTPAQAPVTAQQAQALAAPQGITAENLQRFIMATRGNPAAMRIAQAVAPLIRQGAQTDIRELGAADGQPAGMYVVNQQTGQRVAYVGPAPERNLQTVDLGEGAPEGPGRYAVENGRLRRLGAQPPPSTQTVIDNRGPSTYDTERGRTLAQEEQGVRAGLGVANQTLARLNTIERSLERVTTGVGSGVRMTLGQVAAQLGVPPAVVERLGMDPQAVASAETIRSQASQLLLGMLGPGGFPTQGFSNADREMLERALPSLANSPNGNRAIIGIMRTAAERQREIANAWNEWRRTNGNGMESFDRFQLERLPQITDRDVLAPLLQDAFPASDQPNTPQPPPAAPAARPRARNAQGQVIEYNGSAWVPVQ